MYTLMYVCALKYARTNVKSDCTYSGVYIYKYIHIITYGSEVWNRGMERILQTGMERGYGTGVVPDLVPDLII